MAPQKVRMYQHKFSHDRMSDTHPDARGYGRATETAEVRRLYPEASEREVFLRVTRSLDNDYLDRWAEDPGVRSLLERLRKEIEA